MANTIHSLTGARLLALLVASLLLLEPAVPLYAEALPEGAPPASLQIVILEAGSRSCRPLRNPWCHRRGRRRLCRWS